MKITIGNFTGFTNEDFRWDEAPCVDDFVERANEILAKALEGAERMKGSRYHAVSGNSAWMFHSETLNTINEETHTARLVCIEEIGK